MNIEIKYPNKVEETKDYVNVVLNSEDELGRKLSNGYPQSFETIFGKVGNVRNALEYVKTPGYPVKLLSKSKLTSKEINRLPKRRAYLPNYYAIVAYILTERVKQDKELQEELKNNEKHLTSYYKNSKPILGSNVTVVIPKKENELYIEIYTKISQLLKENRFDEDNINELIKSYIKYPDKELFEGAAFNI